MMTCLFLIFSILYFSESQTAYEIKKFDVVLADTLIIPARELDSLYISVKDGKWIKEGPVTKVSKKYGGTPPFIPEVTKCYPCDTTSVKVKN